MSSVAASRKRCDRPARQPDLLKRSDGTRPHVLLAEDSDPARALMASLLERMGCMVDVASHGQEALACMRLGEYDAVLMDIEMPELDGLSAALEIRKLGGTAAHTPIIALSALITDVASRPLLATAFNAAIAKPACRDDLYRALNALFVPDRSANSVSLLSAYCEPDGPLNNEQLECIFGGLGRSRRRALMSLAADELAHLVLELEGAVLSGAHREVQHIAHKIRGTAANFAAIPLSRLTAALETDCATRMPEDITARIVVITIAARRAVAALRGQARNSRRGQPAKERAHG